MQMRGGEMIVLVEFREMYNRQIGMVYKLSLLLLRNVQDAEDVAQMVFVKAWERKKKFRDREHEKAWFITVTRNQCYDILKSYYRKNRQNLEDFIEIPVAFSSREENELWQGLCTLPKKYTTVLYLYYYEGYSVRELAKILGRRESTIQTQLADGRKKLKEILKEEET